MIFYLLHELFNDKNINIGKRFARVLISGFIFYYIIWFGLIPLSIYQNRLFHFFKLLIYIDILATCVFYGGLFNSIWAFIHGKFNN